MSKHRDGLYREGALTFWRAQATQLAEALSGALAEAGRLDAIAFTQQQLLDAGPPGDATGAMVARQHGLLLQQSAMIEQSTAWFVTIAQAAGFHLTDDHDAGSIVENVVARIERHDKEREQTQAFMLELAQMLDIKLTGSVTEAIEALCAALWPKLNPERKSDSPDGHWLAEMAEIVQLRHGEDFATVVPLRMRTMATRLKDLEEPSAGYFGDLVRALGLEESKTPATDVVARVRELRDGRRSIWKVLEKWLGSEICDDEDAKGVDSWLRKRETEWKEVEKLAETLNAKAKQAVSDHRQALEAKDVEIKALADHIAEQSLKIGKVEAFLDRTKSNPTTSPGVAPLGALPLGVPEVAPPVAQGVLQVHEYSGKFEDPTHPPEVAPPTPGGTPQYNYSGRCANRGCRKKFLTNEANRDQCEDCCPPKTT